MRQTKPSSDLLRVVKWYARNVYGVHEGPGVPPYYCDPVRVGDFAVTPSALATGDEAVLFKLFVCIAMYQALRDVVVMQRQRSLTASEVGVVASLPVLTERIAQHSCVSLDADLFEATCDVYKKDGSVECRRMPASPCHVKDATRIFGRMGDMGKLPTSAWFRSWRFGARSLLAQVVRCEDNPRARAQLVANRLAEIHRVGIKLASLYVSALSVPALAPGLTPWFPTVDGDDLVVVDVHVARAVDLVTRKRVPGSYTQRAAWVRSQAEMIDLSAYDSRLPRRSPRIVQQALYAFGSRSNRTASRDSCVARSTACADCVSKLCPFAAAG